MWRSLESVFPGMEHKGCAFHLAQALWCHIQGGLLSAYTDDEGTYKFLRKVMALCYIPVYTNILFVSRPQKLSQTFCNILTEPELYISTIWSPAS